MRKIASYKNRDNGRKKNREVDWKRKIKRVLLRKTNSDTEEKRGEEEAEHKPSFCPNYCVTVGLSSNLSPSLHTHPPSCHILYRPIWIKREMNWREREQTMEGERDVMDSRTVCLQLVAWLAFSPVSLLRVIAWRDETGAGEKADKKAAVVAGCSAAMPQRDRGHKHTGWQSGDFF